MSGPICAIFIFLPPTRVPIGPTYCDAKVPYDRSKRGTFCALQRRSVARPSRRQEARVVADTKSRVGPEAACGELLPNVSRDDMRAITVSPGIANSARLDDVPEPSAADGPILVRSLALGVCGTDCEILSGAYGCAPPGEPRLVLGHELFGRVEAAPADCGISVGDLPNSPERSLRDGGARCGAKAEQLAADRLVGFSSMSRENARSRPSRRLPKQPDTRRRDA